MRNSGTINPTIEVIRFYTLNVTGPIQTSLVDVELKENVSATVIESVSCASSYNGNSTIPAQIIGSSTRFSLSRHASCDYVFTQDLNRKCHN